MKPLVNRILAPTDLSESSLPALRYARLIADRLGAGLTVLYADPILYPVDFIGSLEPLAVTATPEHLAALRTEVGRHAASVMAGQPYEIEIAIGGAVPVILSAASDRDVDLIVMGTHLRRGWRRAILGSVSEGVLHGSRCPVLTVAAHDPIGMPTPYAISHILCPVNFTDVSRRSLYVAARFAEVFDARLTVIHVVEAGEVTNLAAEEERVRRWIDPGLRETCSVRELVVRGGASERVLDCADDLRADLLVVGAQHKLFRDATVIGTTTERLIRFASCPVLAVPLKPVRLRADVAENERALAGAEV